MGLRLTGGFRGGGGHGAAISQNPDPGFFRARNLGLRPRPVETGWARWLNPTTTLSSEQRLCGGGGCLRAAGSTRFAQKENRRSARLGKPPCRREARLFQEAPQLALLPQVPREPQTLSRSPTQTWGTGGLSRGGKMRHETNPPSVAATCTAGFGTTREHWRGAGSEGGVGSPGAPPGPAPPPASSDSGCEFSSLRSSPGNEDRDACAWAVFWGPT